MNALYWPSTQPQCGNLAIQNNFHHGQPSVPMQWGTPTPSPWNTWQNHAIPHTDYPMDAFTGVLGDMFRACCDGGIDPPVVGTVLMSTASLLTKAIADITWPNGAITCTGANGLLVAKTCSGKSFVQKLATGPINAFLASQNYGSDAEWPLLFAEDLTRAALIDQLAENPVVMLASDEGGLVLPFFRSAAALLVKALDGDPIRHARKTTGRVAIPAPRMTALIGIQPEIFEMNKEAFGVGRGSVAIANRFHFSLSKNPIGPAQLHRHRIPDSVTCKYDIRVEELMGALIAQRKSNKPRPILVLSPSSKEYLIHTGDEIFMSMAPAVLGQDISHYLSRHVERVLKLAGDLHLFEYGVQGQVELPTVVAADKISRWSCKSFHELTFQPRQLNQSECDAMNLERELMHTVAQTGLIEFRLKDVRKYAPNIGLTTARFSRALATLAGSGKFQIRRIGRTDWLQIPAFAPGFQQHYVPRLID